MQQVSEHTKRCRENMMAINTVNTAAPRPRASWRVICISSYGPIYLPVCVWHKVPVHTESHRLISHRSSRCLLSVLYHLSAWAEAE